MRITIFAAVFLLAGCTGSVADHAINGHTQSADNYNFSIVALPSSSYDVTPSGFQLAPSDVVAYRHAQVAAVERFTNCKASDVVPMGNPMHVVVKVNCTSHPSCGRASSEAT